MKNLILICSLSAVTIMCVGLFLFDYIPTSLTVSKANHYETSSDTLTVLSGAEEAKELLTQQNQQTSSQSGSTSTVQTNIIYDIYEITKSDLNSYKQSGILSTR